MGNQTASLAINKTVISEVTMRDRDEKERERRLIFWFWLMHKLMDWPEWIGCNTEVMQPLCFPHLSLKTECCEQCGWCFCPTFSRKSLKVKNKKSSQLLKLCFVDLVPAVLVTQHHVEFRSNNWRVQPSFDALHILHVIWCLKADAPLCQAIVISM